MTLEKCLLSYDLQLSKGSGKESHIRENWPVPGRHFCIWGLSHGSQSVAIEENPLSL